MPGTLDLDWNGVGNNDSKILLATGYGIAYDNDTTSITFGKNPTGAGSGEGKLTATGNALSPYGYLDATGVYYQTSTISDIATAYSGFSISSATMRRRGKLVIVNIRGSLTSSWSVKGNGMTASGLRQLVTLKVPPVMDMYAEGYLQRQSAGIDSYAHMIVVSSGYVYVYAVAPQDSNPSASVTIPSGQYVYIDLIYFCS